MKAYRAMRRARVYVGVQGKRDPTLPIMLEMRDADTVRTVREKVRGQLTPGAAPRDILMLHGQVVSLHFLLSRLC